LVALQAPDTPAGKTSEVEIGDRIWREASWSNAQIIFWLLISLISFLSLTLWYDRPSISHAFQMSYELLSGILLTRPIIWMGQMIQRHSITHKSLTQLPVVLALAFLWNLGRMQMYTTVFPGSGENVWTQLGGWYFSAIMIFSSWTLLYYATRASRLAAAEHNRAVVERMKRLAAENLSREAQIKMLRYQINPHFIFNTMNSISALVSTNRNDKAREMINLFSDFLRASLESDPPIYLALKDELEITRRYLMANSIWRSTACRSHS
jgi:sensor histidine kinase YesM